MLSSLDKKRKISSEQQDSKQDRYKLYRTSKFRDAEDLEKWMARGCAKREKPTHRLKRQSVLVGDAFVNCWDRNGRAQIELPSLCRKIESFSVNFVTGENSVTYANGQQEEVTFVNQR